MSDNQTSRPPRREWASIASHYGPLDGPPAADIEDDEHGALVHASPFGHNGPHLCMSLDRWHEVKIAVDRALDERSAQRYAARLSGAVGL